jgi:hypothetical protein
VFGGLRATLEEGTVVRAVQATRLTQLMAEARRGTDRWMAKGGTGTTLRSVTLPECVAHARKESRPLHVRVEILDPTEAAACEHYARFSQTLGHAPDSAGGVWSAERVSREAYATVLAACWHRQRYGLLNIEVGLAPAITTLQWDLTSQWAALTQRDAHAPALLAERGSPYYDRWGAELQNSLEQARRLPIEAVRDVHLHDEPTVEEVRRLFSALAIPLPKSFDNRAISDIIDMALPSERA